MKTNRTDGQIDLLSYVSARHCPAAPETGGRCEHILAAVPASPVPGEGYDIEEAPQPPADREVSPEQAAELRRHVLEPTAQGRWRTP